MTRAPRSATAVADEAPAEAMQLSAFGVEADAADDADDAITAVAGSNEEPGVSSAPAVGSDDELAVVDGEQDLLDELNAAIDAKNADLAVIEASVAELARDKLALEAERDRLIEARDAAKPAHSNQLEIMRHLAMQQRIREERGAQIQKVRAAGIDLNALLPQRPPVDAVRMRPRPRQFPQRG